MIAFSKMIVEANPRVWMTPFRSVLAPRSLDDSGSMCAAMIKARRAGLGGDLRLLIDNYILLNRNDSYQVTSATAIYTFCMARAINRCWINPLVHGPSDYAFTLKITRFK